MAGVKRGAESGWQSAVSRCGAYEALIRCGSPAAARHEGLLRLEGKECLVADGDIMTIRFNA
jgi:ribosome-binding ATPase YchF (GTP1/OBG family)